MLHMIGVSPFVANWLLLNYQSSNLLVVSMNEVDD